MKTGKRRISHEVGQHRRGRQPLDAVDPCGITREVGAVNVAAAPHHAGDGERQVAHKRAVFALKIDTIRWTDKEGRPMWNTPGSDKVTRATDGVAGAEFPDAINHISKLQFGLLRERVSLNIFLFTGPDEKTEATEKSLSTVATRNSGKFNVLTTKRLEELTRDKLAAQDR